MPPARGVLYGEWNDGGRLVDYKQTAAPSVERVVGMEELHDRIRAAVDSVDHAELARLKNEIRALQSYYEGGEWMADFDADRNGLFPKTVKRGILAEDTLYDLFDDLERMAASR